MKPELLVPAGSLTALKIAHHYGADAVYAGFLRYSLRANDGFTLDELREGSRILHEAGKKFYITLNVFSKNKDADALPDILRDIQSIQPDALIISDPGIFDYVHRHAPEIPIHISTQANVNSWMSVRFWENLGARLCVLAREVTFEEFKEIRRRCPGIGLEMFVHGSMCMSYSGRCLLSHYLTNRSANRGECSNTCRWSYKLYMEEEKRPGQYHPLEQDEHGTYILNSKDLCLLPKLPEILISGVNSLKIEGRNKSDYYVAQATRIYRIAIDEFFKNPNTWDAAPYMEELSSLQNRGYTFGAFEGQMTAEDQNPRTHLSQGTAQNVGMITDVSENGVTMNLYHRLNEGDRIDFVLPRTLSPLSITLKHLTDPHTQARVESIAPGRPGQQLFLDTSNFPDIDDIRKLSPLTVARMPKGVILSPC